MLGFGELSFGILYFALFSQIIYHEHLRQNIGALNRIGRIG